MPPEEATENGPSKGSSSNAHVQELENELLSLIRKRYKVEKSLVDLEYRLYQLEGTYLEDTLTSGSIIRGFEGYMGTRSDRKRGRHTVEQDRIFSHSSTTFQKSCDIKRAEMEAEEAEMAAVLTAAVPIATPAPRLTKKSRHGSTPGTSTPSGSIKKRSIERAQKRSRAASDEPDY